MFEIINVVGFFPNLGILLYIDELMKESAFLPLLIF